MAASFRITCNHFSKQARKCSTETMRFVKDATKLTSINNLYEETSGNQIGFSKRNKQ